MQQFARGCRDDACTIHLTHAQQQQGQGQGFIASCTAYVSLQPHASCATWTLTWTWARGALHVAHCTWRIAGLTTATRAKCTDQRMHGVGNRGLVVIITSERNSGGSAYSYRTESPNGPTISSSRPQTSTNESEPHHTSCTARRMHTLVSLQASIATTTLFTAREIGDGVGARA